MLSKLVGLIILAALTGGCANKFYPASTKINWQEGDLMTCKELQVEYLRADMLEQRIDETGEFDYRTVLAFLRDLGIGNGMSKYHAREALRERVKSIRATQIRKVCLWMETPH